MRDYIFIDKLRVPIRIGCQEEERSNVQEIEVSCKIFSDTKRPALTKNIKDTVCYKETSELILGLGEQSPYILLEEFAELVINKIFSQNPFAQAIEMSLTKFVVNQANGVGVSLVRVRPS